jgi:hypothetical protein
LLLLSFNFCYDICETEDTIHYEANSFLSYPNSTDINLNIIDELIQKNFVTIDFSKNIIIQNNVFGLVFSSILIKNFENCINIDFSSSTENKNITPIYGLKRNESVIAKLSFIDHDEINCKIEYAYEVTEPDYDEYEKYPTMINNTFGDDRDIFDKLKNKYEGKTSYYFLKTNEKLTNDCLDNNCGLCLTDKNTCIVCKNNFTNETDLNGKISKTCLDGSKEETQITDIYISKEETDLIKKDSTDLKIEETDLDKIETDLKKVETDLKMEDTDLKKENEISNKVKISNEKEIYTEKGEISDKEISKMESDSIKKEEDKEILKIESD